MLFNNFYKNFNIGNHHIFKKYEPYTTFEKTKNGA